MRHRMINVTVVRCPHCNEEFDLTSGRIVRVRKEWVGEIEK